MISLYYAKKIGNKYVMNFYADNQEDLAAFDAAKEFMFYGVPAAGSTITVTTGSDGVNYYLNKEGTFVKIETGGDEPVPGEFIQFYKGQTITGIDFGDVQEEETSTGITQFLNGLEGQYTQDGMKELLSLGDGEYGISAVDGSYYGGVGYMLVVGETVVYSTAVNIAGEGTWQMPFDTKLGFQNLTDGKFMIGKTVTVDDDPVDTTPPTWNGVFVGAITGSISYTITANITDGSYTGDASIFENGKASGVITPIEGYMAPEVNSVVVEGASAAVTYDNNQTLISLSNPTGNVTITASCTK